MRRGASQSRMRAGVGAILLVFACLLTAPGMASAANPIGLLYQSPGISPPGANNFSCKPSAPGLVLNALGRSGPADPSFRPDCTGLSLLTAR